MSVRYVRRRVPKETRREQILAAGLDAFLEHGYHGTRIEEIVRRAKIAHGTFYLHFESKQAVFAALIERMLSIFLAVRPAEPEPAITDLASAETVLRMSYRAVLGAFRENRRLCRLMFDEAVGVEQGFAERFAAHQDVWRHRVADTLRQMVEVGVARRDLDVETSASIIVGAVEHVTRQHLLSDRTPDLDRLVDALVRFELTGIR